MGTERRRGNLKCRNVGVGEPAVVGTLAQGSGLQSTASSPVWLAIHVNVTSHAIKRREPLGCGLPLPPIAKCYSVCSVMSEGPSSTSSSADAATAAARVMESQLNTDHSERDVEASKLESELKEDPNARELGEDNRSVSSTRGVTMEIPESRGDRPWPQFPALSSLLSILKAKKVRGISKREVHSAHDFVEIGRAHV